MGQGKAAYLAERSNKEVIKIVSDYKRKGAEVRRAEITIPMNVTYGDDGRSVMEPKVVSGFVVRSGNEVRAFTNVQYLLDTDTEVEVDVNSPDVSILMKDVLSLSGCDSMYRKSIAKNNCLKRTLGRDVTFDESDKRSLFGMKLIPEDWPSDVEKAMDSEVLIVRGDAKKVAEPESEELGM